MAIKIEKRSGELVPFEVDKIKKVINWATEGLDVSSLKLESAVTTLFRNGTKTSDIQENLILTAHKFVTLQESDWRYVAGRLKVMDYWKVVQKSRGYGYEGDFAEYIKWQVGEGRYDFPLDKYTEVELRNAAIFLNPNYDKDYDYAGANLLIKRYLVEDEMPQEAFLVIALILAQDVKEDRFKFIRDVYLAVAQRKISLATPFLANCRRPDGNYSSCFTLSTKDDLLDANDSDSIVDTWRSVANISKNGGGIGNCVSRVRASGSWVKGAKGASHGLIPWIKVLNDIVLSCDQLGRRKGALTVSLHAWHLDIEEFLEIRSEQGDERSKCRDVFGQAICQDLFMERVDNNLDWTLIDPHEVSQVYGVDIVSLPKDEFEELYLRIEREGKLTLSRVVKAKELFKKIISGWVEGGLPYVFFIDNANVVNPNIEEGLIETANLCVVPETKVLTREGYVEIQSLAGREVDLWNGEEWSNCPVFKTGEGQEIVSISFSNGETLECTSYHKFYVQNEYRGKPIEVRAKDLKVNDKLIKYSLPIIPGEYEFPYAYTSGLFSGDGTYRTNDGRPELVLYGEKKDLVSYVDVRNQLQGGSGYSRELDKPATYNDLSGDRVRLGLPMDIPTKFTVPNALHTISSRLLWLAGLFDSDGCLQRNGSNESVVVSSIHKPFLLEVRLMLQTLGVDSKVIDGQEEGLRSMPNGKGGSKEYLCKQSWRICISSVGLHRLGSLGLKTNRLKWTGRRPQRESTQFIKVTSVENNSRVSDTYCFTEAKRHMGMFNGILTGQCCESFSTTVPGKYHHVCSLVSINAANLADDEIDKMTRLSVNILDRALDMTVPPTENARAHLKAFRTIGIGVMGLHDYLARRGIMYQRADKEVSALFEQIAYSSIDESAILGESRGSFGKFSTSTWAKGMILSKPLEWFKDNASVIDVEDWKKLSWKTSKHMRFSQLTSPAPNTSSALIQGCTSSVLPTFGKIFDDGNREGSITVCPTYIKDKFWYYTAAKDIEPMDIARIVVKGIQPWICAGVSYELLFDLNKDYVNAAYVYKVANYIWKNGGKAIYYVRWIKKNEENAEGKVECESCAG